MRCPACPRAPGAGCAWEGIPSLCRLAAGSPRYAALVERLPPRPAPSFPPLAEQAANLAGAVGRWVASGLERSTPEEQERRLETCERCEHFTGTRCRKCGCRLSYKVAMASEHCPIGRW
jgi:hypothetical protein